MNIDIDINNILSNLEYFNLGIADEDGNQTIIKNGNYSLLYNNNEKTLSWKHSWKNEKSSGNQIQGIRNNDEIKYIHINHHDNVVLLLNVTINKIEQAKQRKVGWSIFNNQVAPSGGKKNTTVYKLNGEKVFLIHNNRKIKRSIYLKGNGKTKYCKINKEFISLSKLKKIIE
uniref:Uncharacterized protein n=1 Tax=viral metagenome TaxID=1070528 RepID=A0A6C0LIB5_9ZZZZ